MLSFALWKSGKVRADWKEAVIISLCKGKGSRTVCSNHRPISLLSVPGKVFAHVLLERLQPLLTRLRRPQQSGFTRQSGLFRRPHKSYFLTVRLHTIILIFILQLRRYYAAVLIGRITGLARPFARPSVCPIWSPS